MVGSEIIRGEIGAGDNHRVGGKAANPTGRGHVADIGNDYLAAVTLPMPLTERLTDCGLP